MESVGDKTMKFVYDENARMKEDFKTIEELFLEIVGKVAKRSGETAKEQLTELVSQSEKTSHGTKKVGEKLNEAGKDFARTTAKSAGKVTCVMVEEAT